MKTDLHPVIRALRETTRIKPADLDFIVEHGSAYHGTPLPEGVNRWPLGECIAGAEALSECGFGRFIYGFAMRSGDRQPFPHAWVTEDDFYALDPTLPDPRGNSYWGLDRSHRHRVSEIAVRIFRTATSGGVPVDLLRGGHVQDAFPSVRMKPFRLTL